MLERPFNPVVAVLLCTIPLIGCGNGSSTEPENTSSDLGSFEISYEGDASGSISGPFAVFSAGEFEWSDTTVVFFSVLGVEIPVEPPDPEAGFGLGGLGRQPEPGTYDFDGYDFDDVGIPPEGAFVLRVWDDTKNLEVESTDGTLTIERSTSDRVQGSFEATLTGSGTIIISATGSFDAVSCGASGENCPETVVF